MPNRCRLSDWRPLLRGLFAPGPPFPEALFFGQFTTLFGVFFAHQRILFGFKAIAAEIVSRGQVMGFAQMSLESPHLLAAFQTDDILFFDNFIQWNRGFLYYFHL